MTVPILTKVRANPTRKATLKRQAILDAAAGLFAARGYAEVSVTDIAEAVKSGAGSLYYYFDSRDHLAQEVLLESSRRVISRVNAALERLPEGAGHRDRIVAALQAHLRKVAMSDDYSVAHLRIFDQVPQAIRDRAFQFHEAYTDFWDQLLRDAAAAGALRADLDLIAVRQLLLGSLAWMRQWYKPGAPLPLPQLAHVLTSMFFEGMNPRT